MGLISAGASVGAAFGLTTNSSPVNPEWRRLETISWPSCPGRRPAPITAIECGAKIGFIDSYAACCARVAVCDRDDGVAPMAKET